MGFNVTTSFENNLIQSVSHPDKPKGNPVKEI